MSYLSNYRRLNHRQIILFSLKVISLIAVFSLDVWNFVAENFAIRVEDDQYWKTAAIVAFSILCFILLLLSSMAKSKYVRFITVFYFLLLLLINRLALELTGKYLDVDYISSLLEMADHDTVFLFFNEFFVQLTVALALALGLAFLLSYTPRKIRFPNYILLLIPALMVSYYFILNLMSGFNILPFSPSFLAIPFELPKSFEIKNSIGALNRTKLVYKNKFNNQPEKIVYFIGESIAGSSLTINDGNKGVSPFLTSDYSHVINFGLTSSYTNVSSNSKLLLRVGLQMNQIPDIVFKSFTNPNLWQYAKYAGYKTIYITAWPELFQDYLTTKDLSYVDEIYGGYEGDRAYADFMAAAALKKILAQKGKAFIVVKKLGAHWPYPMASPKGWDIFKPVQVGNDIIKNMSVRKGTGMRFIANSQGLLPLLDDKDKHILLHKIGQLISDNPIKGKYNTGSTRINSYLNAVNWSVDQFFKFLLAGLDNNHIVMIYTSDHGQYISGNDELFMKSHGSLVNPKAAEGIVPLLFFTENPNWKQLLSNAARDSFNKMTHARIFPTIALLLGYDNAWVEENIGKTLLDPAPADRYFYYGPSIFKKGSIHKMYVQ